MLAGIFGKCYGRHTVRRPVTGRRSFRQDAYFIFRQVCCFTLVACLFGFCPIALGGDPETKVVSADLKDTQIPPPTHTLSKLDTDLLDDVSRRSFRYFLEQTDPHTGLVLDRAQTNGKPDQRKNHEHVASIAATGFGLTAYCIAADHRWISREFARERVLAALRFFADKAPQEHGWFYHFMDSTTGERKWHSEISSIDTSLLLAGVLTARQYFDTDPEIVDLAKKIYERVDFPWMLDGSKRYFSHGWTPEKGFLHYRWDTYSELLILYVLGIGSPTHPISGSTWDAWKLPIVGSGDYRYVGGGPLFIQQYSQAWIDLRDRFGPESPSKDSSGVNTVIRPRMNYRVNYFANAVAATRAQRQLFSQKWSHEFPGYGKDVWGVTASDSIKGYTNWGASPTDKRIDGTVVPSAAAGSLMFTPDICIPALRTMLLKYGKKIYGRYGFADAFNPTTGWVSHYVIGIDVGITLLSAENLRTGSVWHWFMKNTEPEHALDMVGLAKPPGSLLDQIRMLLRPRGHGSQSEPGPGQKATAQIAR